MNFLKNIITHFRKRDVTNVAQNDNSEKCSHNTVEPSNVVVEQDVKIIQAIMTSQSVNNHFEDDNAIENESNTNKSNMHQKTVNIINDSDKNLQYLNELEDFLNNNNYFEQSNTLSSETGPNLRKVNESIIDTTDFDEFLREFENKSDCNVDSFGSSASNNINEDIKLNLDEFDKICAVFKDSEENYSSNNDIRMLEHNTLDMSKQQLNKLRQFRKPQKYSSNEFITTHCLVDNGHSNTNIYSTNIRQITSNEHKRINDIQVIKTNNSEVQPIETQTSTFERSKSSINTSIVADLRVEEDNIKIEDTGVQKYVLDSKIKETQDISIQDVSNDENNTGNVKEKFDTTGITSVNNDDSAKSDDLTTLIYKDKKDYASVEFANKVENNTALTPTAKMPTDVETISLLSIEGNMANYDLDFCDGYHSSDFEFITESDAEIEGLVNTSKSVKTNKQSKTKHNVTSANASSNINYNKAGSSKEEAVNNSKIRDNSQNRQSDLQGCRNSETNINFTNNASYSTGNYRRNSRRNHTIPQGEEYLNLFQGIYGSSYSMYLLENKSVRPQTSMNFRYEGVGFRTRLPNREDSDEEYKEEAEESAAMIRELYPSENKSKRKRRRT